MTKESWIKRKVNGNGTAWNKGKRGIFSEESLNKIRLAKLGKPSKRKGIKCSEETKKKMSLSKMGKSINKGRVFSEETRQKMSEAQRGSKSHRWIKNRDELKKLERTLANDSASNVWRKDIYKRDGWKCRIQNNECDGRIEAHHILSWRNHPELRYNLNNGITLCKFHHPRKHEEEERLSPYFQKMVELSNYQLRN